MNESSQRYCDLIMKGGITSGVVYPLAICELAKAFRFKNIGGTSAGAIAAAAAAAAELGRYRNQGGQFSQLAELPRFLSSKAPGSNDTNLLGFFQPQKPTARLFKTCSAALGGGTSAPLRVVLAGLRNFWLAAVIGGLPGLLIAFLAYWSEGWFMSTVSVVAGTLLAVLGAILAMVARFAFMALRRIPENCFGLCSGMNGTGGPNAEALTPWLTRYLNELSGFNPVGPPLTFGHLWNANGTGEAPAINLEMMTTCLTHGRPYRLPFRDDDDTKDCRQFFFRREEFERLFPENVVRWMVEHPRSLFEDSAAAEFIRAGFLPLPGPADFPVVVAVRMSLSFPILLCAVPIHAVDYGRRREEDRRPERCWFSDGGICSNFPIHFFDNVLPRWPTFGIDLAGKHPDYEAGFYMPDRNSGGAMVKWTRFDAGSGLQLLLGFLGTIITTSKDWADNLQCRLPGYRDRIGQVSLMDGDGGLNLDMPPEVIERLCSCGQQAGKEFVRRFAKNDQEIVLNWQNHRRVRLRTALAAIEELLLRFEHVCSEPQPGDPPYPAFATQDCAPSYPWNNREQKDLAASLIERLRAAGAALQSAPARVGLKEDSPRPRPELRPRPRI